MDPENPTLPSKTAPWMRAPCVCVARVFFAKVPGEVLVEVCVERISRVSVLAGRIRWGGRIHTEFFFFLFLLKSRGRRDVTAGWD